MLPSHPHVPILPLLFTDCNYTVRRIVDADHRRIDGVLVKNGYPQRSPSRHAKNLPHPDIRHGNTNEVLFDAEVSLSILSSQFTSFVSTRSCWSGGGCVVGIGGDFIDRSMKIPFPNRNFSQESDTGHNGCRHSCLQLRKSLYFRESTQ